MRLQDIDRLRGFGLFSQSQYSDRHRNDVAEEVDMFVEDMIRKMDDRFLSKDPQKYRGRLRYAIAGMLSVLMDSRENIEEKTLDTMNFDEYDLYRFIHKILNTAHNDNGDEDEEGVNRFDRFSPYFDHMFWYWLEPSREVGNKSFFHKRYLCVESHPYTRLDNRDFSHFANILKRHGKYLQIEVRPGSHYFVDSTLYLRFILDTRGISMEHVQSVIGGYYC